MLDHAFTEFERVIFHIGAFNTRSQMAIGKLGAVKFAEMDMAYYGEPSRPNFLYEIRKENWEKRLTNF
jgi:RimJ/RimL family protein N-acetyltransferase